MPSAKAVKIGKWFVEAFSYADLSRLEEAWLEHPPQKKGELLLASVRYAKKELSGKYSALKAHSRLSRRRDRKARKEEEKEAGPTGKKEKPDSLKG